MSLYIIVSERYITYMMPIYPKSIQTFANGVFHYLKNNVKLVSSPLGLQIFAGLPDQRAHPQADASLGPQAVEDLEPGQREWSSRPVARHKPYYCLDEYPIATSN